MLRKRTTTPRSRRTVTTYGFDEYLVGNGGDPWCGYTNLGLRIPQPSQRYLFVLATCYVPKLSDSRLVGLRFLLTIGADNSQSGQTTRIVEQPVVTPGFHFHDANTSFHLVALKKQPKDYVGQVVTANLVSQGLNASGALTGAPLFSLAYRMSSAPALLYESFTGGTYVAPNGGHPWDDGIDGYQTLLDPTDYPWGQGTEDNVSIPLVPGTTLAVFASVQQSNPVTRQAYIAPSPFKHQGLSPEEQFIFNNSNPGVTLVQPIYWRVACTITMESTVSTAQSLCA